MNSKDFRLMYQDGKPIFEQDNIIEEGRNKQQPIRIQIIKGDRVILCFGSFYEFGEGYWPVVTFIFDIKSRESGWYVDSSHYSYLGDFIPADVMSKYMEHEPEVLGLKEKINLAINNRQDFLFIHSESDWQKLGNDFSLRVNPEFRRW